MLEIITRRKTYPKERIWITAESFRREDLSGLNIWYNSLHLNLYREDFKEISYPAPEKGGLLNSKFLYDLKKTKLASVFDLFEMSYNYELDHIIVKLGKAYPDFSQADCGKSLLEIEGPKLLEQFLFAYEKGDFL